MKPDLSPVIDLALQYNPHMASRDIITINLWVNEGCDIEKDILPTMRLLMQKNPRISTFSYFTNAIQVARLKRELEGKEEERILDKDWEERKAKRMAWVRDKCAQVKLSEPELRWLADYEAHHGKITA